MSGPSLSVIVPALNEAESIAATLRAATRVGVELIVVDGGSTDNTAQIADAAGARVLLCEPGRGRQMNAGAAAATAEQLMFLHADTALPPDFVATVQRILAQSDVAAGAFRLEIAARGVRLRLIERGANFRSRWLRLPYGDQALFLHRSTFIAAGGYRAIPIMEDFDLIRRLAPQGRIELAPATVRTSARRWHHRGPIRNTLINQARIAAYLLGRPPERIAAWLP